LIPQHLITPDGFHAERTCNREQWLTNVAVLLRPWFSARGYEIPLRIRLGVGSLSSSRRVLGVCHSEVDRDGYRHITLSPFFDEPVLVAAVLVHELIHALLPQDERHGRRFAAAAWSLGLEGPVTQVTPGPELAAHLREIVRRVGPYPHKALVA
jgi:hypothetical protein